MTPAAVVRTAEVGLALWVGAESFHPVTRVLAAVRAIHALLCSLLDDPAVRGADAVSRCLVVAAVNVSTDWQPQAAACTAFAALSASCLAHEPRHPSTPLVPYVAAVARVLCVHSVLFHVMRMW
jgi:hypothetical protein